MGVKPDTLTARIAERLDAINKIYFGFAELPDIKWSKGRLQKRYRRITFGCYDIRKKQIRLHPVLKDLRIPEFVTDFVIYHELLHYADYAVYKTASLRRKRGQNRVHTPEFHGREKAFPLKREAGVIMKNIASGCWDFVQSSNRKPLTEHPTDTPPMPAEKGPSSPVFNEYLPFFR